MGYLISKYLVTSLVVVLVSEFARRNEKAGALITALPMVAVLAMIWMVVEHQEPKKIGSYAAYTFWYVLPTLPMFLLIAHLLNRGVNFWLTLLLGCLLTLVCFLVTGLVLKRFGINLLPTA